METTLNSAKFAQRLQKIMDERQLSATAFAEKLEVGRATISHLMSGRNKPSLDFVMKVVSTFPEVQLEELLYGHKKSSTPIEYTDPIPENGGSKNIDVPAVKKVEKVSLEDMEKQSTQKTIERIVIFYRDGTFTNYNPDKTFNS